MRALALDLDDTLLNSSKSIDPNTYTALLKWLSRDNKVYFATSRPIRSVRRFIPTQLLDRATTITLNGAVVHEANHLAIQTLSLGAIAREAVDYLTKKSSAHLTIEMSGEHFASNTKLSEDQLWNIHSARADMLIRMEDVDYDQVVKIAIDGRGRKLTNELTWLRKKQQLNAIPALNHTFINLLPKDIDKSKTLENLAARDGIELSDVIAFGDDEPDLGMLKIAGLSVAMGNATPAVKASADMVIGHHNDDVIGPFIEARLTPGRPD
jgi:Cof subfamily protein (haloacid dehalogenase superfamily)